MAQKLRVAREIPLAKFDRLMETILWEEGTSWNVSPRSDLR